MIKGFEVLLALRGPCSFLRICEPFKSGVVMNERLNKANIIAAAAIFCRLVHLVVHLAAHRQPYSYASGYAADTLVCWVIRTAWIAHEARAKGVRHGWICAVLGMVPA
jgi:hypothetical protein